jgi:hypothetical protein
MAFIFGSLTPSPMPSAAGAYSNFSFDKAGVSAYNGFAKFNCGKSNVMGE